MWFLILSLPVTAFCAASGCVCHCPTVPPCPNVSTPKPKQTWNPAVTPKPVKPATTTLKPTTKHANAPGKPTTHVAGKTTTPAKPTTHVAGTRQVVKRTTQAATTKSPALAPTTENLIPPTVLECMCKMASDCKPLPCGPSGACGYFQITKPYYQDCGELGKGAEDTIETALARCGMDYACSSQCVQAYVDKYLGQCTGVSHNQAMARLHSGGPSGCTNPGTMYYWNKVQTCCKCS